jgi:eukaryotic-like serine/threonine-protein kinase
VNEILNSVARDKNLRILKTLGHGPYGKLYLAEDQSSGKKYGLKLISPEVSRHMPLGGVVDLIRDAMGVNHPNVASMYEFGFTGGQAYIVREYVSGTTTEDLARKSWVSFDELVSIAVQSAHALVALHSQGVVHNNIKPNNLS